MSLGVFNSRSRSDSPSGERLATFALKCFYINTQNAISLRNKLCLPSWPPSQHAGLEGRSKGAGRELRTWCSPSLGSPELCVLQSPESSSNGSNHPGGIAAGALPQLSRCLPALCQCPPFPILSGGTGKLSGLRFLNQLCMFVLSMGNPGASMSQAA